MSPELRLITAAANGDDHAYTRWLTDLRPQLLRYAADRLGGDRAEAEDVVQDASMRALVALRAGRVPANPRAWMYVIVRNRCHDVRSARKSAEPLDDMLGVSARTPGPDEAAAARREFDAVVDAMGALPDAQRRVLVSATFEGRPYEEIAAREETSVQAVKSLVHRARRGLQASGARAAALFPGFVALRHRVRGIGSGAGEQLAAAVTQHTATMGAVIAVAAVPVGVTTVEHHHRAPVHHRAVAVAAAPVPAQVAVRRATQTPKPVAHAAAVDPKLSSVSAVLAACAADQPLTGFDHVALLKAKTKLGEYGGGCTQKLSAALSGVAIP